MTQTPSIGRIVHVGPRKGPYMAAIITAVHNSHSVDLCAFPANAPPMPMGSVQHGDVHGANPVWAWPAFVAPTPVAAAATVKAAAPVKVDPPKTNPEPAVSAEAEVPAEPEAEPAPEVEPVVATPSKPPRARPSRSRP